MITGGTPSMCLGVRVARAVRLRGALPHDNHQHRCDNVALLMGGVSMVGDEVSGAEFRLLGPVEVWVGDRGVDAGQPRQQAVLAALLVEPGRVVPTDTLIARVWGPVIPPQARATLR